MFCALHLTPSPPPSHLPPQGRLTQQELKDALNRSGLSFVGSSDPHEVVDMDDQISNLFDEIEGILGNKKPTLVKKDDDQTGHVDWKALEMLGDESLIQKEKEKPKIDASHSGSDHSNKALQKLGTIKAVDNKKLRSRLGSDMSMDQIKQQQVAEARERKLKGGS